VTRRSWYRPNAALHDAARIERFPTIVRAQSRALTVRVKDRVWHGCRKDDVQMSKPSRQTPPNAEGSASVLCRRALRHRRRGEERRALVLLREAAHSSDQEPHLWAQYGVQCLRMGKKEHGAQALTQAAWLQERAGQHRKAAVTRALASDALRAA